MKRVLIISPHFPPDTSAGTHRIRLLAPHLERYDWSPTIVSVDPQDYETRLDQGLAGLVPDHLRVIRCRALSPRWTRRVGLGDLGLRALPGLRRTCRRLLADEPFDALCITIFPSYPAVLGPSLKRSFQIPFVLDYQDPWVGSWGKTVGGGLNGGADLKSRLTRRLAQFLEPRAVRHADAITAVSEGTYQEIQERNPSTKDTLCAAIPLGGEPADFDYLRQHPRPNRFFDPADGQFHLCYVGTLLPLGFETLRAVLKAVRLLRERRPEIHERFQLHFFGTSNQTDSEAPQRVMPIARELDVADRVTEVAPRIDYLDAVTVQTQASSILMMGSTERHYTASKLYPGLLARRPLLSVYHEASSVVEITRAAVRPPTARVVTYGDQQRAESRVEEIYDELVSLIQDPNYDSRAVDVGKLNEYSARSLAGRLAEVFDQVCANKELISAKPRVAA